MSFSMINKAFSSRNRMYFSRSLIKFKIQSQKTTYFWRELEKKQQLWTVSRESVTGERLISNIKNSIVLIAVWQPCVWLSYHLFWQFLESKWIVQCSTWFSLLRRCEMFWKLFGNSFIPKHVLNAPNIRLCSSVNALATEHIGSHLFFLIVSFWI